jgi:hypothetical protein
VKSGRIICLLGWILAAIVQTNDMLRMPDHVVISGVDLSSANRAVLLRGMFLIAFGLILAFTAFLPRKWTWICALLSAVLYLAHWFPFGSVWTYGLLTVFKGMFLVGWTPALRLSFLVRDIVLPIAFTISAALVVYGQYRPMRAVQS